MQLQDRRHSAAEYWEIEDQTLRQYRLIRSTSLELIAWCFLIFFVYAFEKIWPMVVLIGISCSGSLLNLVILNRTKNTRFCGYVSVAIIFSTIVVANYIIGGIGSPYSTWFYVVPLLAVALTGWGSLGWCTVLSLILIVGFGTIHFQPLYHIHPQQYMVIEWSNHLLAYLVLVTTLNSLMRENVLYEKILRSKNHLLKVEKDKFQHLSRFDQLTNLPNRQYFLHYLQEVLDTLEPSLCLTVFFMDLNQFKYINDHFGHYVGDQVLRQTASRLLMCFREDDFVARLGGDEFTAVTKHTKGATTSKEIAKRIKLEFSKPLVVDGKEYIVSISIGLSSYPKDAKTVAELIKMADSEMYLAKNKGF